MTANASKHEKQATSTAQKGLPAALSGAARFAGSKVAGLSPKTVEPRPSRQPKNRRAATAQTVSGNSFYQIKERGYNLNVGDLDIAVPVDVIDQASAYLAVSKGELMKILRFSPSSLSTWAKKPDALLPASESDRLARLARIIGVIEQALESREDAIEWLNTPVPALGSQKPVSLLGTDAGARLVENTLMRSLAGVYA